MLATDPSETNHEKLVDLKMKYDSLFDYLAKGTIIRSRATWYEKGEKSNKYFFRTRISQRNEELYSNTL